MARQKVKLVFEVALSVHQTVLIDVCLNNFLVQKSVAGWSQPRIRVQDNLDKRQELGMEVTVVLEGSIPGLYHFFVQLFHTIGFEWCSLRQHLVEDASERPDVALLVVRFVLPYLGARVIRSSCLSV